MPAFSTRRACPCSRLEAKSRDGTSVPYFVVGAARVKNARRLLYGYVASKMLLNRFTAVHWGAPGLARGGVLVIANIRGG